MPVNHPDRPQPPGESPRIEIAIAVKDLEDGYQLHFLLTEDPMKLDRFACQLGDPGQVLYLMHSSRGRWLPADSWLEKPLEVVCPFCETPVSHYAGEWQDRIHCECTLWIHPLEMDFLIKAVDEFFWRNQVESARQALAENREFWDL
jgi:hypothetical protein